jgi:hypothetical protein
MSTRHPASATVPRERRPAPQTLHHHEPQRKTRAEHLHRLRLDVPGPDDFALTVDRDLAADEGDAAALRNGHLRVHAQGLHPRRIDELLCHFLLLRL